MLRIQSVARLLAVAVASAVAAAPAAAGFVVVPGANTTAEGGLNNVYPYVIGGSMRYQQVFNASEFATLGGPQTITDIRYRVDGSFPGAFSLTLPSIQIDLSTTAAAAGSLSTTFAANVGADATTVYDGSLTLSSAGVPAPAPFDIVIPLATPFVYDPAAGNLLLDVRKFDGLTGTAGPAGFVVLDAVSTSPVTSRVYSFFVTSPVADGGFESYGLVTGFTFAPAAANAVPAPPAAAALAFGALGLRLARRRAAAPAKS